MSEIQATARFIKNSPQIAVLTGAGVSKESGVPTFRDAQTGLWAQYDPQQLATPEAFKRNPRLVWDWYSFRRDMVNQAKPNPGHRALTELENYCDTLIIITQNVDDLHEQAGSRQIIHLHGNIAASKCYDNCQGDPTHIDITQLTWDQNAGPPICPHCGAYVRPDVVWFGESLPEYALQAALHFSQSCDLMLVVGTSGMVQPAASLPIYAKRAGATVIEVNPDITPLSSIADLRLNGPSGEIIPKIIEALKNA